MTSETCAVALPIPSPEPYHYAIPPALADRVTIGSRVVVPVRASQMVGIVVGLGGGPDTELKSVFLVPDAEPLLPRELLDLAEWMSRYYTTPLGITLRTMLPAALWGRSQLQVQLIRAEAASGGASRDVVEALERRGGRSTATALHRSLKRPVWEVLQRLSRVGAVALETVPPGLGPRERVERILHLTTYLPTILERTDAFGRARVQRALYEAVDGLGGSVPVRHLREVLGFSGAVIRTVVERGLARIEEREELRDPFADVAGVEPPIPTPAQRDAIDAIAGLDAGGAASLFGVTGSGKTLVYLEALRREVDQGRGAIVLVPEIVLTPQTIARVRGLFGEQVAVLHSGLSEAERVDAWRALLRGERSVAVGARSAVFAPVRRLNVIVVDEEHDGSYKHGERPRYHARDVALRRGRQEGARVILGSATPSLETWTARERIRVVSLPDRVTQQPLPPVVLIDLRSEPQVRSSGAIPWSVPLDKAVASALECQDQVLLLLNRRGLAHFLQCYECGLVWECESCSVSLTVHRSPPALRCHYCGFDSPIPTRCPDCGAAAHRTRGVGTQQLERWLAERFPGARLARMDADTTSAKWSHQRILDAVGRREIDILLGTQMIAKGLDFPGVTLVGVVDADTGLHLPDFRAAERTFQLIAQVAGRAGRGPKGGRVLVQTRAPAHHALVSAAAHDFEGFAERELEARRSPPYPPHVALVNVLVSGPVEQEVAAAAVELGDWLRGLVDTRGAGVVEVIGPAPSPLARIKRRWRWHLLLRSVDRQLLGRITRYASTHAPQTQRGAVRVSFDRDPMSLL